MTDSLDPGVRMSSSHALVCAQPAVNATRIARVAIFLKAYVGNDLRIRSDPLLLGHLFLRNVNPEVRAGVLIRIDQFY